MLQRVGARLRALWNWNRQESDLDQEIRFHLSEEVDARVADGFSPEEARRAAQRDFGSVTAVRATTRDVWVWPWLRGMGQDVRFAARLLAKDRWLTVTAVLTLGVGMGANAAVFMEVNAVLVRDLPFRESDRVMVLWAQNDRGRRLRTSAPDYDDWRAQTRSFSGLAAIYDGQSVNVGGADRATERVRSAYVTANLCELIGQTPLIGRDFADADDQPGAEPVAIIGHSVRRQRYDSDPAVLGRTLRANGDVLTIVGVMPPGTFPEQRQYLDASSPVAV